MLDAIRPLDSWRPHWRCRNLGCGVCQQYRLWLKSLDFRMCADGSLVSWQARYAHFPFRYLLTLDGYVVWIVVARSAMRPLSNNAQLREDLKQKGNLPHAGNEFASPVPTRNLTKGCYSAVNFEVTHKSIQVGHPLRSREHITSTILTLSSRLATSSLCWKKFDACWCADLIISAMNIFWRE